MQEVSSVYTSLLVDTNEFPFMPQVFHLLNSHPLGEIDRGSLEGAGHLINGKALIEACLARRIALSAEASSSVQSESDHWVM